MKIVNKLIYSMLILSLVIILSIVYRNNSSSTFSENINKTPIFRVNNNEKKVALTFDINWAENEYIYDILDVLDKYNVKGTFFIMGGWVNYSEENKEKLIKIKESGHEIGNHSYIHPMFTKITEDRMLEEIKKTEDIVKENIDYDMTLFRFPSGDYNDKSLKFVEDLGYKCIQWDVDSVDWKQSGADEEYNRVMKKVKSGSILLFHNNAKYTPSNLSRIIEKLSDDGYEFVPVGELIYTENYYINENGEQNKK